MATLTPNFPGASAEQTGQAPAPPAPSRPGTLAVPSCVVRPTQTEGPYYVAGDLVA